MFWDFFFFFFWSQTCEIFAPWLGIEPTFPALEGKALATGLPGKSLE